MVSGKSPYKFLDAYTKEDSEIFFGRERETEELYQKVFESKLILLYGVSGTGKTSLINCGLANKFEESDWLPVNIRRGRDINTSLSDELIRVSLSDVNQKKSIPELIQSVYLDYFKPVYLIFDQFEEVFIFGNRQERNEFISHIIQILQSEVKCKFIFSIREEYLANLTEFESSVSDFFANRMRIERMTRSHAIQVIEGPSEAQGIELEPGFTDRLLDKLVTDNNEVELTYLQVFLDRIFQMAAAQGDQIIFKNEMLDRAGDVSDLLGKFLDEQVRSLDDPDTGLMILKAFVSIRGTKRQVTESDIQDFTTTFGKTIAEASMKSLVQAFINLRILRDKDEQGRYELRHDSLAEKIYTKITLVEKEILEIIQFIESAYENYQKRGILLNRDDIFYISPYLDRIFLKTELKDFVDECINKLTAKKRSFNRILLFSGVGLFLLLTVIGLYYFRSFFNRKAEKLAHHAILQSDFSPAMSFNTALEAYTTDSTSSGAVQAIFISFYKLLEGGPYYDTQGNILDPVNAIFEFTPCSSEILFAEFSEDGSLIFGFMADDSVKVWDRKGKQLMAVKENQSRIINLELDPDNQHIAAVDISNNAYIWDISGNLLCSLKVGYEYLSPDNSIAFAPGKDLIAAAGFENQIMIYNSNGELLNQIRGHTQPITALKFSPNGKYLATSSRDSTMIIWGLLNSYDFKMVIGYDYFQDIVWSVDFNNYSKWVLSACNDSWGQNTHNLLYINALILYYQVVHDAINEENHAEIPWAPYANAYNACFTANDEAIIVYTLDSASLSETRSDSIPRYAVRLRYSYNSEMFRINPLSKEFRWDDFYEYNGTDMSVNRYVASSIKGEDHTILSNSESMPLVKVPGTHPVFTPDGNFFLTIDGNRLCLHPASERVIIDLVTNRQIFGDLDFHIREWGHYNY